MDNRSIGFFDSGVGGLSVAKVGLKEMPKESFVYFGDTLRMPYGVRSREEIESFTCQAMEFFKSKNVKMAVIACNTATCYGIKKAREMFDFPIFGVVEPAVKTALKTSSNGKIALIATEGTVKSNVYKNYFESYSSTTELMQIGCPDLVVAIEKGDYRDEVIIPVINKYLREFGDFEYDSLILGCTHFPLVEKTFEKILKTYDRDVKLVNPAQTTIEEVKEFLSKEDMLGNHDEEKIDFYVSGSVDNFKETLTKVIDLKPYKVGFNHKELG